MTRLKGKIALENMETALKENLKNKPGSMKPPTSCIPPVAIYALGAAMQNGGDKYGPFNYRETDVTASVFFDAMMRHLLDWKDGEDFAQDSNVHHLAHLMAGAAIILDAQLHGTFVDDRVMVQQSNGTSNMRGLWKRELLEGQKK
jgi:hypothetical protein